MKGLMRFIGLCITMGGTLLGSLVFAQPVSAATDKYTVLPGDSLWKISLTYHVGWPEIYNSNRGIIKNPALIYPGQVLQIPLVSSTVTNYEQQVLVLCNQIRAQNGLPSLTMNWQLERMGRIKAQEMASKKYFSHTSPVYGTPFQMMKSFGISYTYAGENIAAGQPTPQAVVTSWMNSPGHKANILSKNYTQIGIGYASGGPYGTYWTQEFIRP
jgi:uncharacterized YkwD family protein